LVDPSGDALPYATLPLIPLLSYARRYLGRDQGTAKTGLKWVVSAAGDKYLASVVGGDFKAVDQSGEPPLAQIAERLDTLH
jgi:hypothetical protein